MTTTRSAESLAGIANSEKFVQLTRPSAAAGPEPGNEAPCRPPPAPGRRCRMFTTACMTRP